MKRKFRIWAIYRESLQTCAFVKHRETTSNYSKENFLNIHICLDRIGFQLKLYASMICHHRDHRKFFPVQKKIRRGQLNQSTAGA